MLALKGGGGIWQRLEWAGFLAVMMLYITWGRHYDGIWRYLCHAHLTEYIKTTEINAIKSKSDEIHRQYLTLKPYFTAIAVPVTL